MNAGGQVAVLQVAAPAQLVGDIARHVARPAFGRIEADDARGAFVLPADQVLQLAPAAKKSLSISRCWRPGTSPLRLNMGGASDHPVLHVA
jgi:hypothetical protein